jgi:hypothetical protein
MHARTLPATALALLAHVACLTILGASPAASAALASSAGPLQADVQDDVQADAQADGLAALDGEWL